MQNPHFEFNFIDVFAGAGGLSHGMEMAGLTCVLGVEWDKHAAATFKHNHHHAEVFNDDIEKLTPQKIENLIKGKTVHAVIGGPPCQGFSTAGIGDPLDKRNQLFKEFIRIVKVTSPLFVVIENVTGLLAKKNEKTIEAIFKLFNKMGYNMDVRVLSAEHYGVPEKRRRTIFIGSKINTAISFPTPLSHPERTVGEVFKELKAKDGKFYNHDIEKSKIKNELDLMRIKCIPEGKGIRYAEDEARFFANNDKIKMNINWDEIPENRLRQTRYQRLDRKKSSPTIMTHRHSYFHPTENRYLTAREAAAIQSFPSDFIFQGPLSAQWKQIGNAVPPLLGKALGLKLIELINSADLQLGAHKAKSAKNSIHAMRKKAFVYSSTNLPSSK